MNAFIKNAISENATSVPMDCNKSGLFAILATGLRLGARGICDSRVLASRVAVSRRGVCLGSLALLLFASMPGPGHAQDAATAGSAAAARQPVILVVGDSLSAEYGLQRGKGWVTLLEQKLAQEKIPAQIVNASISGDTTSGGRSRLPALLLKHKPQIVVLELGANDALRGSSLDMTEKNLLAMTQASQKVGAKVLLVGMQLPPNYGSAYGEKFSGLFPKVARATRSALVPFFLKDVADIADAPRLFQADRLHPNESAQPIMLGNVWPELRKLIK
jgi:acyl-CoA thioesterase I